jgi:hypothetical protein
VVWSSYPSEVGYLLFSVSAGLCFWWGSRGGDGWGRRRGRSIGVG